jgi:hypothetical protein
MQIVGTHLSDHALKIWGTPDDDLFARSAFNRYYYATFLVSRQFLVETLGITGLPHKVLPEYLKGNFRKTVQRQIQANFKAGVLTQGERGRMMGTLSHNIVLLEQLLVEAYGVRVLADYEPGIPVQRKDKTFHLGTSTLPAASKWQSRAQMHCKNLQKLWKDLGN